MKPGSFEMITKERLDAHEHVVVYGAGPASRSISWAVENVYNCFNYCFCDRDEKKQNDDPPHPVYSIEKAASLKAAFFIIGFFNNFSEKIESAYNALQRNGVADDDIIIIDMESDFFNDLYAEYLSKYIANGIKNAKDREKIKKVKRIVFLSGGFSYEKELQGGGGPIGVICMQKKLLGDEYKDVKLEYPYYSSNSEYENPINRFNYMTGACQATYEMGLKDKDTIYIANDIFSAFGLFMAGKNYVILFHAQGDVVKEITLWGEVLSKREAELIRKIEEVAAQNAFKLLFPSFGAKEYFDKSFEKTLTYKSGHPLYNTLSSFENPEIVGDLRKDCSCVTFLSIGQMTRLKGVDRIPEFLKKYADHSKKSIRWIIVADGVLKDEVNEKMKKLHDLGYDIGYVNIDKKIPHSQIYYLFSICDVYLMLHRVSIFDFATLEAMYMSKAIILSDIPGNQEFNIRDNIMLVDEDTDYHGVVDYVHRRNDYGMLNRKVYDDAFSLDPFLNRYNSFIDEFIDGVEN